jgi:hypothetical protein
VGDEPFSVSFEVDNFRLFSMLLVLVRFLRPFKFFINVLYRNTEYYCDNLDINKVLDFGFTGAE